ncbi:hypothetical protein GSI_12955 [Ganoderma sinense ZZ0214-1]|uniref:Uncharacterized protein n=1 Tax=Ganoderma sinense ZZ0214-1 TaxID=1077348 RepID=A0A2G8RU69_9APHY|nr:hypothetical protein GSI_12955 [Ganoderma sinense ZZ0214-1]
MGAGTTKKKTRGQNSKTEDQPSIPTPATATKQKIPNVDWGANGSHLMWLLITEAEKEENRKVLFGKRSDQVSFLLHGARIFSNILQELVAEHKTSVHKRIASIVIPKIYALDSSVAGDRVKGRVASLVSTYRSLATKVTSTGRGVLDMPILEEELEDSLEECDSVTPDDGSTTAWIANIPRDGPDHDTPEKTRNVWAQVEKDWPFFPRMHRLLCTRPNVVPVAITTGVGPRGESTVYYQVQPPPSQSHASPTPLVNGNIDPTLRGLDVNQLPARPAPPSESMPTASSQSTVTLSSPPVMTPNQRRLAAAVAKADKSIKTVPKKRTLEESFLEATHVV